MRSWDVLLTMALIYASFTQLLRYAARRRVALCGASGGDRGGGGLDEGLDVLAARGPRVGAVG